MSLSIYIHIPYCLQRCPYCDFTTFEQNKILKPDLYIDALLKEIEHRSAKVCNQKVSTIYFGGGTPSLFQAFLLNRVLKKLRTHFQFEQSIECTIEINPGTLSEKKIEEYLKIGINRFSLGVQSFNPRHLKRLGRKHSVDDTLKSLNQIKELNFSLDLLFALPKQSLEELEKDIDQLLLFKPKHVSAYCLTLSTGHFLNQNRPSDEIQIKMFELIESRFLKEGLLKYEISNFAKKGFESQHNLAYWSDKNFWGLGLSAHSYLRNDNFGVRFWNPTKFSDYLQQVELKTTDLPHKVLPLKQKEFLHQKEALSDLCHSFLRTKKGLPIQILKEKFSNPLLSSCFKQIESLKNKKLLEEKNGFLSLSKQGELLSNQVFLELNFS